MRTEYQARTADLSGIFIVFAHLHDAKRWWSEQVAPAKPGNLHYGAVIVESVRETHMEAETARLNFMLRRDGSAKFARECLALGAEGLLLDGQEPPSPAFLELARKAIDRARGAPEPTARVVWPESAT